MTKNFLKKLVESKEEEVKALKRKMPEKELYMKAFGLPVCRPFFQNLAKPGEKGINIIAEIKRASPSKGTIRPDLSPAFYALEYEKGGASAISVLTETKYFMGSIDDLKEAKSASILPVLRKDFIISSYQIYESAIAGADAVLLIVKILEKEKLKDLLCLSRELKMDALVEIASEEEVEAASFAGARLIGINNRDLNSFETNLGTAERLACLLNPDQIPVAARGIA